MYIYSYDINIIKLSMNLHVDPVLHPEAKLPESALSGLWGHLCMGRGAEG